MISVQRLFEQNAIKIYCDMDGVLTDFEKAAKKAYPDFKPFEQELWKRVYKAGSKYWSEMEWTKDGKELWNYIKQFNPVILSAPPKTGKQEAIKGKKVWIKRELGNSYANTAIIVPSKDKQKFANKNSILIDDREKNIQEWKMAGGIGILHKNTKNTIKKLNLKGG